MANHLNPQEWTLPTCKIGRITSPIYRRPISFFLITTLLLGLLFSPFSYAEDAAWIPYDAKYVAILNGAVVDDEGLRTLKYLGNQRFRFKATAENMLFKIEEVSEFQVIGDRLLPIQYQSTRSNPFKKRTKAVGFDWDKKTLHYQDRKRSGTKKISGDLQDPLSSVLEIARQLRSGATKITFQEASGRKIKNREFNVIGEEKLSIPYGTLKTIKLKKRDKDRETQIWIAPKLNYIAAKVKQKDKSGEVYELELKSYKPRNTILIPFPKEEEKLIEAAITEPPPTIEDIK